jgi:replication-associated recombination protein RarA
MSHEQYADLQKYTIPASNMVKIVYEDMVQRKIECWEDEANTLIEAALNGDKDALFNLLELTYLNAYNEGELNYATIQKAD